MEKLIFYSSRWKSFLIFVSALLFSVGGFFLIPDKYILGWVLLISGVLGGAISFALLLVPRLASLGLSSDGFMVRYLFRKDFLRWKDIAEFGLLKINTTTLVVFRFHDSYQGKKFGRVLSRTISGFHEATLPSYAISPKKLLAIMNDWHERYG